MSKWAKSKKYKPKNKNIERRTTFYSVPGTQEIIYKDEYKKKPWWKFW